MITVEADVPLHWERGSEPLVRQELLSAPTHLGLSPAYTGDFPLIEYLKIMFLTHAFFFKEINFSGWNSSSEGKCTSWRGS